MLLYYHSWMFYNHFITTLYHFWDQPIDQVPSASCCFLLVFYIAGNQYQTESKHRETFCGFFGPEDHQWARAAPQGGGGVPRGGHNPLGRAWAPRHALVGCAHLAVTNFLIRL